MWSRGPQSDSVRCVIFMEKMRIISSISKHVLAIPVLSKCDFCLHCGFGAPAPLRRFVGTTSVVSPRLGANLINLLFSETRPS